MDHAKHLLQQQPIVICSKGFADGLGFLSEAAQKKFLENYIACTTDACRGSINGIFSGLFWLEKRKGTGKIREAIDSKRLKVEVSDDIIGVSSALH